VVEVTVGGRVSESTGMVCDLAELDRCVHKEVVSIFDHTNLNLHKHFAAVVPTTENLCIKIHELLRDNLSGAELVGVRVEETGNNSFEYKGGQ
jgi:6-pyruvoyltetrahydropterin/6-carboxytetrahydropterin synthase